MTAKSSGIFLENSNLILSANDRWVPINLSGDLKATENVWAVTAGAITEEKLSDDAVNESKLANNAVSTAEFAASSVSGSLLENGSVLENVMGVRAITTELIEDGSISSSAKFAPSSITSAKIASRLSKDRFTGAFATAAFQSASVANANIVPGILTSAKIFDNIFTTQLFALESVGESKFGSGITGDKLGSDSISSVMLQTSSITDAKIGANQVTSAKLADGSVINSKLANGAITTNKIVSLGNANLYDPVTLPLDTPSLIYSTSWTGNAPIYATTTAAGQFGLATRLTSSRKVGFGYDFSSTGMIGIIGTNPSSVNRRVWMADIPEFTRQRFYVDEKEAMYLTGTEFGLTLTANSTSTTTGSLVTAGGVGVSSFGCANLTSPRFLSGNFEILPREIKSSAVSFTFNPNLTVGSAAFSGVGTLGALTSTSHTSSGTLTASFTSSDTTTLVVDNTSMTGTKAVGSGTEASPILFASGALSVPSQPFARVNLVQVSGTANVRFTWNRSFFPVGGTSIISTPTATTFNNTITIPEAGQYMIFGDVTFSTTSSNSRNVTFTINGVASTVTIRAGDTQGVPLVYQLTVAGTPGTITATRATDTAFEAAFANQLTILRMN